MRIWDDVIPEKDRLVYEKVGFGRRAGLGTKPALLIVDVNYNWTGERGVPLLKVIERYPFACGEASWRAVDLIAELLPLARQKKVKVVYTTADTQIRQAFAIPAKASRAGEIKNIEGGNDIVKEIAPREGDVVIYKPKASAFFGTALPSILTAWGIDTVLCCGTSTSGCVRASVVDASAHNFRVAVIEECTFDRGEISHKVNLFDMNAKYADVISFEEARKYVLSL